MFSSLVISGTPTGLTQRDVLAIGPSGLCPEIAIQLQPVVYCEYVPSATIIDPFKNQQRLTISVAPTSFCISDVLTTTIYLGSDIPKPSSSSATTPNRSATSPARSAISSATSSNLPDLFIGQGLPSGSVTGLPENQFLFLAFTSPAGEVRKRRNQVARQPKDDSAQLLGLVNLDSGLVGGYTPDECDRSSPLLLQSGALVQYGQNVAKVPGRDIAPLGLLDDAAGGINTTFTLTNGFLAWNTPDIGDATFHNCAGAVFAAFGTSPAGCSPIRIGAINGFACRDRVSQTRDPNAFFIAPLAVTKPPVTSVSITQSVTMSRGSPASPMTELSSGSKTLSRYASTLQLSTLDRSTSSYITSMVISQSTFTTTTRNSPSSSLPHSTASAPAVSPSSGVDDCESLSGTHTTPNQDIWDVFCATVVVARFLQRRYATSLKDCMAVAAEYPAYDAVTYVASRAECTLHYGFRSLANGYMYPADSTDTSSAVIRSQPRTSHSTSASRI